MPKWRDYLWEFEDDGQGGFSLTGNVFNALQEDNK